MAWLIAIGHVNSLCVPLASRILVTSADEHDERFVINFVVSVPAGNFVRFPFAFRDAGKIDSLLSVRPSYVYLFNRRWIDIGPVEYTHTRVKDAKDLTNGDFQPNAKSVIDNFIFTISTLPSSKASSSKDTQNMAQLT